MPLITDAQEMWHKMIKYIFLCLTFLLYNQQICASNIVIPSADEITEDLKYIIDRENLNIKYLENNLKKFTDYYLENVKDIQFNANFVRQEEIISDTFTYIKLKLFMMQNVNDSASCYSDALNDLDKAYLDFINDSEHCKFHSDTTFNRFTRDFLAFKKDAKRIIKQLTKILNMCKLDEEINEEGRKYCNRQIIPIHELSLIANHTYQYEMQNIHLTDQILQDYLHCNLIAVKPVVEMAQHYVDTLKYYCDFPDVAIPDDKSWQVATSLENEI